MKSKTYSKDIILVKRSQILRKIQFVFFASLVIIAASCKKSSSDVVFKATLKGESETPPNSSTATGDATLTYNKDTKIFSIVVHFSGLTATASHIHKGPVGVAGNVIFPFTPPITSPINYTSPVLTTSQDSALNANLYYVNVHSAVYPAGEIRGQLIKQ